MIDGNKLAKDLEFMAGFGEGLPVVLVVSLHQVKGKDGKVKTVIGFEEWKKVYPQQAESEMPEYGPEDIKEVETVK